MTQFTTSDYDTSKTYFRIAGIWHVETSVHVSDGWRRDDSQGSSHQSKKIVSSQEILEILAEAQLRRSKVKPLRPSAKALLSKRQAEDDAKDLFEKQVYESVKPYVPEGFKAVLYRDQISLVRHPFSVSVKIDRSGPIIDIILAFKSLVYDFEKQQKEHAEFERLRQLKKSK